MRLFKLKKGMEWSALGKIIFVLVCIVILIFIMRAIFGKSWGLLDKLKSALGG